MDPESDRKSGGAEFFVKVWSIRSKIFSEDFSGRDLGVADTAEAAKKMLARFWAADADRERFPDGLIALRENGEEEVSALVSRQDEEMAALVLRERAALEAARIEEAAGPEKWAGKPSAARRIQGI